LSIRTCLVIAGIVATALFAQKGGPAAVPATPPQSVAPEVPDLRVERLPEVTDSLLQRKLDSLARAADTTAAPLRSDSQADSAARAAGDSALALIKAGKYVARTEYDKSNFDHWKVDTLFQKQMKDIVLGEWRTALIPHGHAFRDAALVFGRNDTLYGVTRTYSDSGRYQMTGEYKFRARYRFDNDSTIVSREVFLDRNVVRWDHIRFKVKGSTLSYHLSKLEFRDLNDNWLNAMQGFDNVAPEVYYRMVAPVPASAPAGK